jgi:protein SCO1/2
MFKLRVLIPVVLAAAGLVALGVYRATATPGPGVRVAAPGRPELSIPLPPFSLVDQEGKAFTDRDLAGRVWIVNFIFTRCPTICPKLTAQMASLVERTKDVEGLGFVSISVDPENDPPPVLRAYGERHGADFSRWSFLTGDQRALEATVLQGFKVALGRDDTGAIVHAERFVLVDDEGRIRGYYDADAAGEAELLEAAKALAAAR